MIVEQFLQWITTANPEKRARATHALARAFFVSELSEDDCHAAEAAMTFLLDDPDVRVRFALCDVLAEEPEAPRHIVLGLLYDVDQISLEIVKKSPVLIDSELVDIVALRRKPFQMAVAGRSKVSASVAAAIAEVCEGVVCLELLANPGSVILPRTLYRLAERFGKLEAMQQALLQHPDLPIAARQLVIANMSDALGRKAVKKSFMIASEAKTASREARERATLSLIRHLPDEELTDLVVHLRDTHQMTTVLLLRAICAGQVDFFAEALALLAGVDRQRIMALLCDPAGRTLRTVYTKAGLPDAAYPAFAIAFDVYIEEGAVDGIQDQYRFTRIMIERILERYRGIGGAAGDTAEVDEILSMLRRFASETARDAARDYVQNHITLPDEHPARLPEARLQISAA